MPSCGLHNNWPRFPGKTAENLRHSARTGGETSAPRYILKPEGWWKSQFEAYATTESLRILDYWYDYVYSRRRPRAAAGSWSGALLARGDAQAIVDNRNAKATLAADTTHT